MLLNEVLVNPVPSYTGLITSYFEIELLELSHNSAKYKIDRKQKKGNHPLFNNIFEYHSKLWVHKVSSSIITDHIGFIIGTSVGNISWLPVVLETKPFAFPYGIVKTSDTESDDAILFKIITENTFEVYILDGKRYDAINYLQLLVDGHLEAEIEQIKSK